VRAIITATPIVVAVPLPSHQILARTVSVIFIICFTDLSVES
jgi:hypothetical protein